MNILTEFPLFDDGFDYEIVIDSPAGDIVMVDVKETMEGSYREVVRLDPIVGLTTSPSLVTTGNRISAPVDGMMIRVCTRREPAPGTTITVNFNRVSR